VSNATTIVFIDSRVSDLQSIIAGFSADTPWMILDPTHNGLEQIASGLGAAVR
jgi:hypothetical protein